MKNLIICEDWKEPDGFHLIKHRLLLRSSFSENKLKFAVFKGMAQFYVRKYLGKIGYRLLGIQFERLTDAFYNKIP